MSVVTSTVTYQGKEISNWLEYIKAKFSDTNYFELERHEGEDEEFQDYVIIQSKTNKTKIWFYGLGKNPLLLHDCQYTNDDCRGWSGETCGENPDKWGTFTQENLNITDDILSTPIYKGWISIDYYLGKELYKAVSYSDKDKTEPPHVYLGQKYGCLFFPLFPVAILLNVLLKKGIIGRRDEIVIEPIIKR